MLKPETDTMKDRMAYYEAVMAGKDPMRPGADEVMYDYVEDVEALLAYIRYMEVKFDD